MESSHSDLRLVADGMGWDGMGQDGMGCENILAIRSRVRIDRIDFGDLLNYWRYEIDSDGKKIKKSCPFEWIGVIF